MKTLKFSENLIPLILSGKKIVTWRLFDDKDLQVGDELEFINKSNGGKFAKAKIISLYEKRLGEINKSDYEGHERHESQEKMMETYKKYYGGKVNENTQVKIIKFEIIK